MRLDIIEREKRSEREKEKEKEIERKKEREREKTERDTERERVGYLNSANMFKNNEHKIVNVKNMLLIIYGIKLN